jgi:hypothetical protein
MFYIAGLRYVGNQCTENLLHITYASTDTANTQIDGVTVTPIDTSVKIKENGRHKTITGSH